MVTETIDDVDVITLSREEIWEIIDRDAHEYLGMDAETFVRLYREGDLDDTFAVGMIAEWVWLGGFAE